MAQKHLGDDQPPIYQTVLTAVDRIGVDLDLLSDLSVKNFYSKLTPLSPNGCLALTVLLIGNKSGVISMVVLA